MKPDFVLSHISDVSGIINEVFINNHMYAINPDVTILSDRTEVTIPGFAFLLNYQKINELFKILSLVGYEYFRRSTTEDFAYFSFDIHESLVNDDGDPNDIVYDIVAYKSYPTVRVPTMISFKLTIAMCKIELSTQYFKSININSTTELIEKIESMYDDRIKHFTTLNDMDWGL